MDVKKVLSLPVVDRLSTTRDSALIEVASSTRMSVTTEGKKTSSVKVSGSISIYSCRLEGEKNVFNGEDPCRSLSWKFGNFMNSYKACTILAQPRFDQRTKVFLNSPKTHTSSGGNLWL